MIEVSGTTITRVLHAQKRGEDPFGIGSDGIDRTSRARGAVHLALDGVDADVAAGLARMVTAHLSGTRTIGNPHGLMPIDRLCARLLQHRGVDPLVATWLSLLDADLHLDDTVRGTTAAIMDGTSPANADHNTTRVELAGNGWSFWRIGGELDVPTPPETLLAAVVGGPLAALVSHPVLDMHPFTVLEANAGARRTTIVVDHRPAPADVGDLVGMGPCGCR